MDYPLPEGYNMLQSSMVKIWRFPRGTSKSSNLIGFYIRNHQFRGISIYGNLHLVFKPFYGNARTTVIRPTSKNL